MDSLEEQIWKCPLFKHCSQEEIRALLRLDGWSRRSFARDEMVAFEEDDCPAVGFILNGSILVQRFYPSGKVITIDTLGAGSSFGEALIFANDQRYPATLAAAEATLVAYLPLEEAARFCQSSPGFAHGLLRMLSNRVLMLNRRIKGLSYQTVRQKVTNYILEEWAAQKNDTIVVRATRSELADALGIPRPSLSRELVAMQEDGLIRFDRKTITILNGEELERSLA